MMNGGRLLLGALGILVLGTGMRAIAIENSGSSPYQGIVERNVFGLKPPPPPPDPEANKPPPPKIILQGIMHFGGTKRALLKVQLPPKPPDPAKEVPLILREGDRDGDVEVMEINDKPGSEFVKVNDFGTITNLTFENNGIKTASASAPGGPPGPPKGGPPPGANPFGSGGGPNTGGPPMRPMRLPPSGAAASSGVPGGYGGPSGYGGSGGYGRALTPASYGGMPAPATYGALPAAPAYSPTPAVVTGGGAAGTLALPGMVSASPTGASQPNYPPDPNLTPEQQQAMELLYTEKYQSEIAAGKMPSIPGFNQSPGNQNTSGQNSTSGKPTGPPLSPGASRLPPAAQ